LAGLFQKKGEGVLTLPQFAGKAKAAVSNGGRTKESGTLHGVRWWKGHLDLPRDGGRTGALNEAKKKSRSEIGCQILNRPEWEGKGEGADGQASSLPLDGKPKRGEYVHHTAFNAFCK